MQPVDVTAVFVDDQEQDRELFGGLLRGAGLHVASISPTELLDTVDLVAHNVASCDATVVLLDYRLDEDHSIRYRGASLAVAIRERLPDVPLVLLTTEAKLHDLEQHAGVEDIFDWRVLKGQLVDAPEQIRARVIDMGRAYWWLHEDEALAALPEWDRVAAALGGSKEELADLIQRDPIDLSELTSTQLARWLFRTALRSEGPLIGRATAQAVAGVPAADFLTLERQGFWTDATYSGVFASFGDLYWAVRLREQIAELVGSHGPASSELRAEAISKASGHECQPARCVWCQRLRVERACSICGEPVDASHALIAKTTLPSWAERPVICFRCLATGRATPADLAPGAERVAEQLITGALAEPKPSSREL